MELQVLSIRRSLIAGMVYTARWCFSMNPESMSESEDPESMRDISGIGNQLGGDLDNEGVRSSDGGIEGDGSLCTNR